jgi:murein L,D-transpeptidase YafK
LPITDEKIRELYLLAADARDAGQQQIPVHIFPCRMTSENRQNLLAPHQPELLPFWDNLSEAYDFFERKKILPTYTIEPGTGNYVLTQ